MSKEECLFDLPLMDISPSQLEVSIKNQFEKLGEQATLRTLRKAAEVDLGLEPGGLDAFKDTVRLC